MHDVLLGYVVHRQCHRSWIAAGATRARRAGPAGFQRADGWTSTVTRGSVRPAAFASYMLRHGLPSGHRPVPPELAAAARNLVAGDSATRVAANAVQACEQLSHHLARMIGKIGIRTLLARSATLTSVRFPWLASAIPKTASAASPWAALREAMELQHPPTARDAFVDLLKTVIDLLGRLIGDALVGQLLRELWPELFPSPAKGIP